MPAIKAFRFMSFELPRRQPLLPFSPTEENISEQLPPFLCRRASHALAQPLLLQLSRADGRMMSHAIVAAA